MKRHEVLKKKTQNSGTQTENTNQQRNFDRRETVVGKLQTAREVQAIITKVKNWLNKCPDISEYEPIPDLDIELKDLRKESTHF